MKPKKFKKLTLNKSTISNLDKAHQGNVKGGGSEPGVTCFKCPTEGVMCQPTAQCSGICTATMATCETNDGGATCDGATCNCATQANEWTCVGACTYTC